MHGRACTAGYPPDSDAAGGDEESRTTAPRAQRVMDAEPYSPYTVEEQLLRLRLHLQH